MKTAMKKLLSLMLVAVLLVSAVPFQASAEVMPASVIASLTVPVKVYVNNEYATDRSVEVTLTGLTLTEDLGMSLLKNTANRSVQKWTIGDSTANALGTTITLNDTMQAGVLNGSYFLKLYVSEDVATTEPKAVPVDIYVNGQFEYNTTMQVPVAGVSLNSTLAFSLLSNKVESTNGYSFGSWAKAGATDATNSFLAYGDVYDGLSYVINFSKANNPTNPTNPSNVTVTVNYTYGGKNYTTSFTVPAGTTITADMVANAIKNAIGNPNVIVNVTGINGTTANATVTQNQTNQVCLTINYSGSFSGVANKWVNPGTWVNATDVKNAVANVSGYAASSFTMSKPFESKRMDVSETISVTVTLNNPTTNPTDKFPESVYLAIWSYGNVSSPIKTIKLDNYNCVKNGTVYLETDVRSIILNSYTAKDSNGIKLDGLYVSDGKTAANYVKDDGKQSSVNVAELRKNGVVYLNVWIDNYKAKTSSNADPSNPKTGDTIVTTVTIMSLSIASLAAVYYISKKRAVR